MQEPQPVHSSVLITTAIFTTPSKKNLDIQSLAQNASEMTIYDFANL
jgi:hypothetical protein